jgi:hypothetical protein
MKNGLREIQAYSSNSDRELDYKKRYWFHHWITKETALLENERGELITAYFSEFRFKVEKDEDDLDRKDREISDLEEEVEDLEDRLSQYESGSLLDEWKAENLKKVERK